MVTQTYAKNYSRFKFRPLDGSAERSMSWNWALILYYTCLSTAWSARILIEAYAGKGAHVDGGEVEQLLAVAKIYARAMFLFAYWDMKYL